MNIKEDYAWKAKSRIRNNNNPLLPRNIRGLIVGKSNCGKTTLLLNLLLQPDWLDYNHLYVFGRSLHQQEYSIMRRLRRWIEQETNDKHISTSKCIDKGKSITTGSYR